ncbi:hypothetical protein BXZ70DRAFT_222102 [Cristinia sonorae]|uniref:Fungal-type protein kinase domain-containing protein n=1 Tax=Cristinia sonorae TaxID=1940300 RepID=A0A8K0XPE0_9AGAR|nr:hypothetical protein BXZ70DRAFT_222102 [Cristinia sonorae]
MSELGLWIGPIAPQEFLQSFIPQSDLLPKEISNIVDFSSFASLEEEGEMYGAMINAVMDHGLMPKITELANSLPERNEQDYQRDVSWLFDAPMPENVRRYIMALQENIVVCKPQRAYDPFKEVEVQPDNNSDYFSLYQEIRYPESRIIPDTEKAFGTQIHLLNHASSLFAHQHRLFCFNILICGDTARFIRWDRGGAVVSSSFDYAKHPLILAEFFWRYDGLTAAQRGYDPTARPAEESEALRLREAVKKHENGSKRRIPDMREKTLKKSFTPFVITMNGQTPSGKRKIGKYVVQAPMHTPFTPVGRSTQVYYALDLRTDELVCLKDYWRPAEATRPPESVVYARLRKHRIPHLPTMLLSGDVGPAQLTEKTKFQQTYTAIWVRAYIRRHPACIAECGKKLVEKDVEPDKDPLETPSVLYLSTRPSTFSHYRIVQKLLYSLSTAESSKVLVRAIRNSIICLTTAYEKANVLHRDVSSGNVMLDEDGQGVLNDWDHALMFERTDEAEVPLSGRTGTWYFLSVDLARHPYKNHDILDDLESCFWVLLWQAIHHLKSSADYTDLEIFKEQNNFGKTVAMLKGGSWKLDHIIDRSALHSLEFK